MKIITKKQIEETMEIKVPACYEKWGTYYKLTENGLSCAFEKGIYTVTPEESNFSEEVVKLVSKGKEISESEFNEFFANTIENIGLMAGISNVPTLQLQD